MARKNADYRSPIFYNILNEVNDELRENSCPEISADMGAIFESQFDIGKYDTTVIWRVTSKNCPQLKDPKIISKLKKRLTYKFPNYIQNKIIKLADPSWQKDKQGNFIGSIVIKITELEDNIITREDLDLYNKGDFDAIQHCFEIESRMYRRPGDTRDQATRLNDFTDALIYEPLLEKTQLKGITNLKLQHQVEAITLETDKKPDFIGTINNNQVKIEGKSTRVAKQYLDTPIGHHEFAAYFKHRLESTGSESIGSIHETDYVLFVLKKTGDVICINANNFEDNWLAGKINF